MSREKEEATCGQETWEVARQGVAANELGVAGASHTRKRGGGTGLAGGYAVQKGVVRAADSDAATVGTVTVRRARRCAAQKKRGKALGHPGKEKEGEGSTRAAQLRGHGARQ
jgi:hypothetical protein